MMKSHNELEESSHSLKDFSRNLEKSAIADAETSQTDHEALTNTPSTTNSPAQSPKSTGGFFRQHSVQSQQEILQLNEDSHTWNLSSKRKQQMQQNGAHQKNIQFCFEKLQKYLKSDNAFEFRFKVVVTFLFLLIFLLVLITRYFHYNLQITQAINDQMFIYKDAKKLTFLNDRGENLLNLHFGRHIPNDIKPINCRSISPQHKLCFDWKYRAHLSVQANKELFQDSFGRTESVTCYDLFWKTYQKNSQIKDCFDMNDAHWFGMGDIYDLQVPLNKMSVSEKPFITSHNKNQSLSGPIIGRVWFSSRGVLLTVPLDVPLFVSINSTEDPKKLCFISKKSYPYYTDNLQNYFAHLSYSICLAQNVDTLQNYFFKLQLTSKINEMNDSQRNTKFEKRRTNREVEDNIFMDRIIWSTNVHVLPNFTQQNVQSYVDQITNYGFGGIILLDSRWENSIGELRFNENVFNNPKALVNILHNKGFKIMLTISPNVEMRSEIVETASRYIMLDSVLQTPLLTRCSSDLHKLCALINFTDPVNREQMRTTLNRQFINNSLGLSVDGFYFQSIQSSLLPRHLIYENNYLNPDIFVNEMNSLIKSLFTSIGISSSIDSRNHSGYVTLYPRKSTWQDLKSIIPSVLSLGLIGYPLVNTGVVGGVNLFTYVKNETDYINKELYLRWLQTVIFLPVVEFAEPPGGHDLDVIKIAKRLLKLRSEHFVPEMKSALIEYQQKGSPIVRPMWWGQNESEAFMIQDQFMVGDEIVVAPIIEEGKTERDIYLPHGWWKDEILAQVIRGGKWMKKYQVPLDKVAFFIRNEPSADIQSSF